MNAPVRQFPATSAVRGEEPLSIGVVGPPGGGKTFSSLRLAKGMQEVRGGDIHLIDTEGGRARKYADSFKFKHVNFEPPHRPSDFLEAIKQQLRANPAAIIIDSMSDEHEGQGGYLEWHDEQVPAMGGNEWAAWSKPKAARKRLITGLLQIKVPLIFTFRAREKTAQNPNKAAKEKIINIGWQPVAPLEIVHSLDLTCILPPRADGVAVWESSKIGEDFIIKLPNFLAPFIQQGQALDEATGRALAKWAKGGADTKSTTRTAASEAAPPAPPQEPTPGGAAGSWEDYVERWAVILDDATDAKQLHDTWTAGRVARNKITWPEDKTFDGLKSRVEAKIKTLRGDQT